MSTDTMREALARISLCSQNSASSKEECGRIARTALAQSEAQPSVSVEPVAWMSGNGHPQHISAVQTATDKRLYGPWKPLYTAAPAAPAYVPLSDDSIIDLWAEHRSTRALPDYKQFARAVEDVVVARMRGEGK